MILDRMGIELIPGNQGMNCPGNGENGICCCDECDYLMCCLPDHQEDLCKTCTDFRCPLKYATNQP